MNILASRREMLFSIVRLSWFNEKFTELTFNEIYGYQYVKFMSSAMAWKSGNDQTNQKYYAMQGKSAKEEDNFREKTNRSSCCTLEVQQQLYYQ